MMIREIVTQLKKHAPFTALGTLSGIVIMLFFLFGGVSSSVSELLFWGMHPLHVFLSALVTTAMFRLHGRGTILKTLFIGYVGSVGIATLSDCIIPFVGEWLLQMPHKGLHFGFIEKWWLVNPLALLGIATAWIWPKTKFPHAGHVFISTWASLFHIMMARGEGPLSFVMGVAIAVFLFLAVWVPCCASDIVFPLLFVKKADER